MNASHCPSSLWPRFIPNHCGVFQGIFHWLILYTLPTCPEPAWQNMAQSPLNGTTQPVKIEEEGWSPAMDRWWLKEKLLSTGHHEAWFCLKPRLMWGAHTHRGTRTNVRSSYSQRESAMTGISNTWCSSDKIKWPHLDLQQIRSMDSLP